MTTHALSESSRKPVDDVIKVMLVDDESRFRKNTAKRLELRGFCVDQAEDVADAVTKLAVKHIDVVVADLRMSGGTGIDLIEQATNELPPLKWIILTGHASVQTALDSGRLGVLEYLEKPCDLDVLEKAIRRAANRPTPQDARPRQPASADSKKSQLIGTSSAMANVRRFIDQAAAGDFPVLLLGESGTGKELIARLIHAQSRRSNRPFVPLNCAGVSDELLGNELFGHAPGAFTGAASAQGGLFEAAEGGVLLLDEIGDMSPANQSSMLRVIESGGYRRLGESEERFADVRIMAATHQDLEVQIHKGAFRSDLFHRLNVFTLTIAPLREHKEDIPPLVQHTLSQIDPAENKKHVTDDAMKVLQAYDWPGNVRELKNCMLRASAFSGSEGIDANALDFLMNTKTFHQGTQDAGLQSLADVERDLLKDALEQTNWNKKAAAERLGISRNQLYTRIARYGLKDPGKD